MTATISNRYLQRHNDYYEHAQFPPSPVMEQPKCTLPSISNLIGLADAGSPTHEAPPSQLHSPRSEGTFRWGASTANTVTNSCLQDLQDGHLATG